MSLNFPCIAIFSSDCLWQLQVEERAPNAMPQVINLLHVEFIQNKDVNMQVPAEFTFEY